MIGKINKKHIVAIVSIFAIFCLIGVAYAEVNKDYELEVEVVGNGTIIGWGKCDEGSSVTLEATADYGYKFSGWYDHDIFLSKSAILNTTADDSHNFKAVFEKETYTLKVSSNYDGGNVTNGGSHKYLTNIKLVATVNSGYEFLGWEENNKILSNSTNYTYEITKNSVVTAKYMILHDASFTLSNTLPLKDQTFTCTSKYNVEIESRSWTITLSDSNLGILNCSKIWSETSSDCKITSKEPAVLNITQDITYKDGQKAKYTKSVLVDGTVSKKYTWKYSYDETVENNWWIFNWTSVDTINKTVTKSLNLRFSDYVDYVDNTEIRSGAQILNRAYFINLMVTHDDPVIISLANFFKEYTKGLSSLERAQCVLNFVQSIEYQLDEDFNGKREYFKFPYETLYDQRGDCEDTAILFAAIIKAMGYDIILLELPNHMATAISCSDVPGPHYTYNKVKYYYCETATEMGWYSVGEIPREYISATPIIYNIT